MISGRMRRPDEQVTQIADGVVLHVVHVPEAAQCPRLQPFRGEGTEIQVVPTKPIGVPLVRLNVELHVCCPKPTGELDVPAPVDSG